MGEDEDSGPVAIETRNLTKRFGPKTAIRNLNLKIQHSRITALFGPNGAGKTTLIRILSTLSSPTSGRVFVKGMDISNNGREVRGRIGVVLHDPLLYDDLSAAENLRFYCRMFGSPDSRVDELLDLFGLRHRKNDRIGVLSSGMVKRLSIARAMIHDPEILIFDEPFSSLDSDSIAKTMSLIGQLRDGGKTVLLATHHLREGYQVGERLLVMKKGRVVYDARKAETGADEFESAYDELTGAGS
ncbi:MAG: ABC transporter ATP-binding protein [Candidatus Thermoplasmatota archaeon]|nr:ABC transporter ATP-binding protein [Candidatus Thermoplasmatota archaeon]